MKTPASRSKPALRRAAPDALLRPTHRSRGIAVSLHAKCIVVAERKALVTSATFTNRDQTRNLEMGVLVEDPAFGSQLVPRWRGLVEAGLLVQA